MNLNRKIRKMFAYVCAVVMVITGMAVYGSLLYLLKDDFYLQCLNMVKQRLKGVLAN
mgnify:CR=1 FL=1